MHRTTRAVLLGALSLPILPALAQEGDSFLTFIDLSQRFEFGDNLELETPPEGESAIATTRLGFGIESESDRQILAFTASGGLTIQNTPDTDGTEFELGTPQVRLSYTRIGSDSRFEVDGVFRTDFIDTLSFEDFTNAEGVIEIPEDFAGLQGTGERTRYDLGVGLQLGVNAPLGFDLSAGISGTNYSGTSDPDLFDFQRTRLGADALFRISPVMTGILGLAYSTYDAEDDDDTYRTQTTADVGLTYALSPRTDLEARIGATQTVTEENGIETLDSTSPVGSLGLVTAMPDGGEATIDFAVSVDGDTGDQRTDLVAGRSYNLPSGALAFTIGVTDPEFGDLAPIGSLSWTRDFRAAQVSAQLRRSVTSSNQDDTRLATLAVLSYEQNIDEISGFSLDLTYGQTEASGTEPATTRAGITAAYRRALTEDWDLNTGINYRTLDQDDGWTDSPSIFLTIGRRFEF